MQVWVDKDSAICKCHYLEKELVKAIGDYRFNKVNSTWVFPLRKLVDIIDNLRIEYSDETKVIYDHLVQEKQKYHSLINQADKIKAGQFDGQILDQEGNDLLAGCYQHQKKAILLASLFGSYALFLETGCGKTLVAIRLIQYWKVPTMVIAPLSTLESVWVNEIEKWSQLKTIVLWNNLKAIEWDYDVYLINYESFKKISSQSKEFIEQKIGCMCIDECSKMKNPRSQITKEILKYNHSVVHRLVLSGTPNPNSLLEYWGPMEFINDEILG